MKNIIITGGSEGLGAELCKQLGKENKIILIARNEKRLKAVASKCNADFYACDITNIEQLKDTFNKILKRYKHIDCLINNAGVWLQGNIEDNSFEEIKRTIDVNVYGTIACTKAIIPAMKNQKYGQIINITSQSGVVIEEFCPVYCASKHALTTFRECIQNDLMANNIRMTNVCPGLMQTDFFEKAGNHIPKEVMDNCGLRLKDAALQIKELIDMSDKIWIPSIEIKNKNNIGKS